MSEENTAQIKLTIEDLVACGQSNQAVLLRKRPFWYIIASILIIFAVFAWATARDGEFWEAFGIMSAAGLATFGVLILLTRWLFIPLSAKRQLGQSVALHDPYKLRFNDEGVSFVSERASAKFAWHEFHRWHEGPSHFMLYQSAALYNVVPKGALDQAQIDAMRSLLESRGPKRA